MTALHLTMSNSTMVISPDAARTARRLATCAQVGLVRIETSTVTAPQYGALQVKRIVTGGATFSTGAVRAIVGIDAIRAIGLK